MQHIKRLQIALGILTLALMLLVGTCIIFLFTYTPTAPTVTDKPNEKGPSNTPVATAPVLDAVAQQGQSLFNNNCAACHAVTAEVVVGPGLKGITQRRPEAWLVSWIKNSQKVIASGDQYAVDVYNKYNKTPMPAFDSFTDDELKSIIKYMDVAGK